MLRSTVLTLALASGAVSASAQDLTITFENLLDEGGTALTPVFAGLSDGSFNLFDAGSTASAGLERVAELGATDVLTAEFAAGTNAGSQSATTATGPILGGGSASVNFAVSDPIANRFLDFASMVVPTNDLFIGSLNPIEVFDAAGNFNGPFEIVILGSQVWDAGTEVNNADNGAAFLQGIDGTAGEVEGGTVGLFADQPGYIAYLDSLVGRTTAPGFEIASTFRQGTEIARITVVPAPGAAAVMGIAGLGLVRRRR